MELINWCPYPGKIFFRDGGSAAHTGFRSSGQAVSPYRYIHTTGGTFCGFVSGETAKNHDFSAGKCFKNSKQMRPVILIFSDLYDMISTSSGEL
ncbi:hypothetical protein ACTQ56_06940 [[Clostridium] aminophilum]|uniref:hypothetical protein n=1 Tax=[Clostridium] aminophilum TaxID=1526 RepID=UPI003F9C5916